MTEFAGRLTLPLDKEDWDLLLQRAREEKLPKAEILRRALRLYTPTVRMPAATEPRNAANG